MIGSGLALLTELMENIEPPPSECCQNINVTHSNDHVKVIYQNLYGTYSVVGTDSHHHQYYLQDVDENYGIWWCNDIKNWVIGHATTMVEATTIGSCDGFYACANKSSICVDTFGYDWMWYDYTNGGVKISAGGGLKLVCSNPTTKGRTVHHHQKRKSGQNEIFQDMDPKKIAAEIKECPVYADITTIGTFEFNFLQQYFK